MAEDNDALHNLILNVLRTIGLSDDITKPSGTTDKNLVEELDETLEVDQELGESSFTQDSPNRGEHIDVRKKFVQEGRVGPTISDTEYVDLLGRALDRHPSIFANFRRRAIRVRTSSFELVGDILLSLSSIKVKDISLDFLADLSETFKVLKQDGLIFLSFVTIWCVLATSLFTLLASKSFTSWRVSMPNSVSK
ncbi:hypothetical protein F0562_017897 [Nyssa sinensis]|uniref:Uncharacterized protein n=1 Tax=Nyssa sinensis TaxID=561372 RepID=A0A5J4ZAV1_9ASTE|nr:hypothetical protein F0562_017897 [Nyssa sinensis]